VNPQRRKAIILGVLMTALALAAMRDLLRLGAASPWRNMDDFPDFYCAGWALDAKANPYTYEPLHACEHRVNTADTFRGRLFRSDSAVAVPAPLPAYDFLPFMAMARLPFGVARDLEAIAVVGAVVLGAISLMGLGIPIAVSGAALLLSTAYVELNTGQVVPFALLALILCGLTLARGYALLAGFLAVSTAIEPVVGLPVMLAMLLYVPRARWPVLVTAAIFAVIAVLTVGPSTLWEYATRVVPAQAASEIHFPYQFSLTYALARAGISAEAARLAGSLSYLVLLALGLWLAPRAARALQRRELIVFIPAFCCAVAGPYLHQEELCLALPALLVLAVATTGRARIVFAIALCVVSVPWILVWGIKQLFLASIFCCALILWRLGIPRWPAIAGFCAIAATIYVFELYPPHLPVPRATVVQSYAATTLVQDEWRVYAEQRSTSDPLWFAIKIPTWAALLATLILTIRLSLRRDQPSSARI
jgi:hypothetical protein